MPEDIYRISWTEIHIELLKFIPIDAALHVNMVVRTIGSLRYFHDGFQRAVGNSWIRESICIDYHREYNTPPDAITAKVMLFGLFYALNVENISRTHKFVRRLRKRYSKVGIRKAHKGLPGGVTWARKPERVFWPKSLQS